MKRLKLMSTITLSLMLSFTACEKEGNDILPNSAQNTSSKSSATPTKSGGEFPDGYWDDLQQFIFDVMEENELSDMEIEKALYYTESALDWQLTNEDSTHFTDIVVADNFQYVLSNLSELNQQHYITKTDLATLNDDIYSDIFDQANIVADAAGVNVVVHVVDLTWEVGTGGSATVYATAYLGKQKARVPSCNTEDRLSGERYDCSQNSTGTTAAEHVNRFTWPLTCGTWNNKLQCSKSTGIIVDNKIGGQIAGTDCNASLHDGLSSDCLNASVLNNDHGEVQLAWNQQCGLISGGGKLRNVWFMDMASSPNSEHAAQYLTAKCVPFCTMLPCAPTLNHVPTVFPTTQDD